MGAAGRSLDIYFNDTYKVGSGPAQEFTLEESVDQAFSQFDVQLAASVRSSGLGFAASFLAAELAESLGVNDDGFGGELFSYAATTGIDSILDFALDAVGQSIPIADAGIEGALFYGSDGLGSGGFVIPNPGAFIGSHLGHRIFEPQNIGGELFNVAGSTLIASVLDNVSHGRDIFTGFADASGNIFALPDKAANDNTPWPARHARAA